MARSRSAKKNGSGVNRLKLANGSIAEEMNLKKIQHQPVRATTQATQSKRKRLSKRDKNQRMRAAQDFPGLEDQMAEEARNLVVGEGLLTFKCSSVSPPTASESESSIELETTQEPGKSAISDKEKTSEAKFTENAEFISLDSNSESELGQQFARFEQHKNTSAPWLMRLSEDEYETYSSCGDKLGAELLDYLRYMSPQQNEANRREACITRLRRVVQQLWPSAQVAVFGSHATGMYLPDADIDVVILSSDLRFKIRQEMHRLAARLKSNRLTDSVMVIAHARVPIVKYVEQGSQISVDIAFGQLGGLETAVLVSSWLQEIPILKPLGMFVRQFLKRKNLSDVPSGGLGGYAMICMIYSRLKYLESVNPEAFQSNNIFSNCGLFLLDFFDYYGNNFDNTSLAVKCVHPYKPITKRSNGDMITPQSVGLAIEDPQNKTNNISKASYNYPAVKRGFQNAADFLKVKCLKWHNSRSIDSFLAPLLKLSGDEPLRTRVRLDLALKTKSVSMPSKYLTIQSPQNSRKSTRSGKKPENSIQEVDNITRNTQGVKRTLGSQIQKGSSDQQKTFNGEAPTQTKEALTEEEMKRIKRRQRFGGDSYSGSTAHVISLHDKSPSGKSSGPDKKLNEPAKKHEYAKSKEASFDNEYVNEPNSKDTDIPSHSRLLDSPIDDDNDSRIKLTSAERRQFWKRKSGTQPQELSEKIDV